MKAREVYFITHLCRFSVIQVMFASLDFKVKLPQRERNKQKQLSECFLLYSQPPRQFIQRENKFLSRKAKWVINSRTPGRKNKSWLRVILLKLTEMCSNTSGFDSKKTPVSSPGQRSPTGIYAAGLCVCVCVCLCVFREKHKRASGQSS